MDSGTLAQWVSAIVSIFALFISLGSIWYAHQAKRHQLAKADVDASIRRIHEKVEVFGRDVSDLRDRVARAEQELADTPGASAVHELALSIKELAGDMKSVVTRIDGMSQIVDRQERVTTRMENYLRELDRDVARRSDR